MFFRILCYASTVIIIGQSSVSAQDDVSAVTSETAADTGATDTTGKIEFAGIPIVNYDRTYGAYFGAMASIFYRISSTDTISPMSTTGAGGIYTTNGSWFLGVYQKMYFKEDTWRLTAAVAGGSIFFQTFVEDPTGGGGSFIDYNTSLNLIYLKPERMIFNDFYAGVIGAYVRAETEFDYIDTATGEKVMDERNLNTLGFSLSYDSRDYVYNPSAGFFWNYSNSYYRSWLGSDNDFNKHKIALNSFFSIGGQRQILATRIYASIAAGDVPFQGQTAVGGEDIRGYSEGRYRDNQVYDIQAEYRRNIYGKFGMVAFVGLASAVPKFSDLFDSEILPAGGIGFRYMMLKEKKMNAGIDIAVGKDDWSLSFRIGESFSK